MLVRMWWRDTPIYFWWEYRFVQLLGMKAARLFRNLKIDLQSTIHLLGIYPRKIKINKVKSYFTAEFTVAKIWNQCKYPPTNNWTNIYIYIGLYIYICTHTYTVIKRMKFYPLQHNGLETILLTEINQSQKTNIMFSLIRAS